MLQRIILTFIFFTVVAGHANKPVHLAMQGELRALVECLRLLEEAAKVKFDEQMKSFHNDEKKCDIERDTDFKKIMERSAALEAEFDNIT